MRKLYPRRFSLEDASFSRASQAYGTNGNLAVFNVPRIEQTDFGKVMMVEEGTTNLIPVANQKFAGWIAYEGAVVTLTQNQVVPEWGATDATRIQINGGTHTFKYLIYLQHPSVVGQTYVASLYIKNTGNHPVIFHTNLSSKSHQTVNVGETTLVKITEVGNGFNTFQIQIRALDAAHSLDFIAWRPMAEVKAYATSFIESTRQPEFLTLPTAGLSPTEGTIEGIVEINDLAKIQKGNFNVNHIFYLQKSLDTDYGIGLYHYYNTPNWRLMIRGDNQVASTVDIADSLTPNGYYYYKVFWTTSVAKVEFWNLTTKTKVAEASINNPNLPSGLKSILYLGSQHGSVWYANTRFGRHRLSNVARTEDPDFDNLMPRDEYTTAIFDPTYSFLK